MSIGIDFVLRATTTAFKSGMASANNAVKDLKKSLREFDVGNGFKNALGIGGVIAGFRTAITHAQTLRDEADKLGKSIDAGTRSVAELGDAVGRIGTGFKGALTEGLSFFTRLGDAARQFFQGVTQGQEDAARKMVQTTAKAAEEAEARLRKSKEENSPERQVVAQDKLDKSRMDGMAKGTDAQKKLIRLINERVALEEKLSRTGEATVAYKEIQAEIEKNELETKEAAAGLDKEATDKQQKLQKLKFEGLKDGQKAVELRKSEKTLEENIKNLKASGLSTTQAEIDLQEIKNELGKRDEEVQQKFSPSVEQLAKMDVGTGVAQDDPRLQARKILEKEKFAAEAGARGDIKGAMKFGREAQSMRDSLSNVSGNGTALTAETAEAALRKALETTNKELVAVKEALAGIIKAQK